MPGVYKRFCAKEGCNAWQRDSGLCYQHEPGHEPKSKTGSQTHRVESLPGGLPAQETRRQWLHCQSAVDTVDLSSPEHSHGIDPDVETYYQWLAEGNKGVVL